MEVLHSFLDFFLHLDDHLFEMILNYGVWIYAILFLIIFVETGLVVMPFLPGDSLLFAAGTFCAGITKDGQTAELNLWLVLILLLIAAVIGDALNYYLGKRVGLKMLQWKIRGKQLVKQEYIDKTHTFYEKHGPKTIIIARFVPIVRTFAPFVAGIGEMSYGKFFRFNLIGGFSWVVGLTLLGYFFGGLEIVQENFETVIFGIILISIIPIIIEFIRNKAASKKTKK
ncbi:DedA family protein [Crocinitomicaceae bacterium CZZ-1]|uniref:DedA family protein n=1 Tax=Taishania pollutisoli TaxID=2766479 RepID=A0A8J6TZS5_9FLAO|nr:DedA family protein [Taishania pollutisoli]MBC9812503.1 DedA family protein [Taishania pollutisoli]